MKKFLRLILFSIFITSIECDGFSKETLKIGAFFFKDEMELVAAMDTAIEDINKLEMEFNVEFEAIKRYLPEDDSILLQELTCQMFDEGVVAIFGPSSKTTSDIVNVLCNMTGVPHIQYDWNVDEVDMVRSKCLSTVNVAPSVQTLSTAIYEIMKTSPGYNWNSFIIVQEASTDLSRMQELMAWRQFNKYGIKVVKFKRNDDYRVVWKIVKNFKDKNIVLDCPHDIQLEVLNASIYFNLTGMFNNFFLTNLDTHLSGLDSLSSDNVTANITAIRLRPYVPSPVRGENDVFQADEQDTFRTVKSQNLYDAVVLFFNALRQQYAPNEVPTQRLSCTGGVHWKEGLDIVEKMKKIDSKFIEPHFKTQKLMLNMYGIRQDFNLELYEPMTKITLNMWNRKRGLVSYDEILANSTKVLPKKKVAGTEEKKKTKYKVVARYGPPYFMRRPDPDGRHLEGNDRFEGYAVDLIFKLGTKLNFDVVFEQVEDNNYGRYNEETGEWDGIIRQLMDNQAQMGICDLTITQSRRTVVDFTVPFMQLGVQILHYKTPPPKKDLFHFLEPFASEVWFYLLVSMLLMSLVFLFLARLSPKEWTEESQDDKTTVASFKWSLRNSLHLHIGSILAVGCDILPAGGAARLSTTFWWIFALLMSQTYLAKMTSHITSQKMEGSINSLNDLVHQKKVQYGTVRAGSTQLTFAESNESDYRMAWNNMKSFKPDALTQSNEEGVKRVMKSKGKYAFLLETPSLQYHLQKNCELVKVGQPFGEKFYGIAMPLNAPYRTEISVAILKLSEDGELYKLKQAWFNNGTTCEDEPKNDADSQVVDMEAMNGLFVVLIAGLIVAMLIGIAEFFWHMRKLTIMKKLRQKKAMKADFRFFLRFWREEKPLAIYNCAGLDYGSNGSLLTSSNNTAEDTSKEKRKKLKRQKVEEKKA